MTKKTPKFFIFVDDWLGIKEEHFVFVFFSLQWFLCSHHLWSLPMWARTQTHTQIQTRNVKHNWWAQWTFHRFFHSRLFFFLSVRDAIDDFVVVVVDAAFISSQWLLLISFRSLSFVLAVQSAQCVAECNRFRLPISISYRPKCFYIIIIIAHRAMTRLEWIRNGQSERNEDFSFRLLTFCWLSFKYVFFFLLHFHVDSNRTDLTMFIFLFFFSFLFR